MQLLFLVPIREHICKPANLKVKGQSLMEMWG